MRKVILGARVSSFGRGAVLGLLFIYVLNISIL